MIPNQFNDRLLLGLRGTMSEAELHFLRARLYGGKLNKARRGELRTMLPAGLIYDPEGHVELDPDRQVQQAIRKVFELFERFRMLGRSCAISSRPRSGSPCDCEPALRRERRSGPRRAEPGSKIVKNPRYAGTYFFGRTASAKVFPKDLPAAQRKVQIPNAHPGYIAGSNPWPISRSLWKTTHDEELNCMSAAMRRACPECKASSCVAAAVVA